MDVASPRADSGVAELLGRDDELAQLYDLIDAIGQRGGALVVRGEAGIGKSALLEAAAVRARERDVPVASVTGMPSEARFAFAGLHQLLLPFLGARDRLPRAAASRPRDGDRPRRRRRPGSVPGRAGGPRVVDGGRGEEAAALSGRGRAVARRAVVGGARLRRASARAGAGDRALRRARRHCERPRRVRAPRAPPRRARRGVLEGAPRADGAGSALSPQGANP